MLSFASLCFSAPRHPRVAEVLLQHDDLVCSAVQRVCDYDSFGLLGVLLPPCPAKVKSGSLKARENTIVDASLSMVDAVSAAVRLEWKDGSKRVDPVLSAVIRVVSDSSVDAVAARKSARSFLRSLKSDLSPLRVGLQALVPEFLRPITGHVDFALLEVLIRAGQWVQECYIDSLIFGYEPVGDVGFVGCHRPIVDKPRREFSRSDNAKSFDTAVSILEKRCRREKHDAQALADQADIWRVTMEECDKQFCDGPFTRAQVEKHFRDTP